MSTKIDLKFCWKTFPKWMPPFLAGSSSDKVSDGECWHTGIMGTHICSSLVPGCVKLLCLSLPWALWRHNASYILPAVLTLLLCMCVSSLWHTSTLLLCPLSAVSLHEADWSRVLPELHFSTKSPSTVWPYKAANSQKWEKYALLLKLPLSVFFSHLQFLSLLLLSLFFSISHSILLVFVLFFPALQTIGLLPRNDIILFLLVCCLCLIRGTFMSLCLIFFLPIYLPKQ